MDIVNKSLQVPLTVKDDDLTEAASDHDESFGENETFFFRSNHYVDISFKNIYEYSPLKETLEEEIKTVQELWLNLSGRECKHITTGQHNPRFMIRVIKGQYLNTTTRTMKEVEDESGGSLDKTKQLLNKCATNDPPDLCNISGFLSQCFQNDYQLKSHKIRQQLVNGFSVVFYDNKSGLKADPKLVNKQGSCRIIACCTFFPQFGHGAYIGYISVSEGKYTRAMYGRNATNDKFQRNKFYRLLYYVVQQYCASFAWASKQHIYIQGHVSNPAVERFMMSGFQQVKRTMLKGMMMRMITMNDVLIHFFRKFVIQMIITL